MRETQITTGESSRTVDTLEFMRRAYIHVDYVYAILIYIGGHYLCIYSFAPGVINFRYVFYDGIVYAMIFATDV